MVIALSAKKLPEIAEDKEALIRRRLDPIPEK
jgi:hypothetical protein